jgi:hypothetical protein
MVARTRLYAECGRGILYSNLLYTPLTIVSGVTWV